MPRHNRVNPSIPVPPVEPQGYGTPREYVLKEAMRITHHDRNANYGNPEDNFQHIANLWEDYLAVSGRKAELEPADVAVMMMLVKIARLGNNRMHQDSTIDIAGYAACLGDCQVGFLAGTKPI